MYFKCSERKLAWSRKCLPNLMYSQCDQIRRFIVLWATFQSLWQQFYAQIVHILGNICKRVKSFIFLLKNRFWATFIDIWRLLLTFSDFYWSHCVQETSHWKNSTWFWFLDVSIFFNNGPIPASFSFIFVFSTCYNLNSNLNW